MFTVSFLIPAADNVGRVFTSSEVAAFEADLIALFGGKVAQAVEAAKARFAQEAIFVQYLGLSEVL